MVSKLANQINAIAEKNQKYWANRLRRAAVPKVVTGKIIRGGGGGQ